MQRLASGVASVLTSRKFFIFVVILLIVQAAWLALSFSYPMLWDEYYHFGLIQFYGHHLSPFLSSQPHSLDIYGNVISSPKYLYHWLMSFPFRTVALFTHDQAIQIITLRFINVGLFAGALVAWRQALLRIARSRALVHFGLLILVLIPMSSLLAAQINYDNMQFLLAGLVIYWALRFIQAKQFEAKWLFLVVGGSLIACLVKITFGPIFAGVVLYLAYYIYKRWGKTSAGQFTSSFGALNRWGQIGLIILVLISVGFFAQRFGANLLTYHQLQPNCAKVLGDARCRQFSPYKTEQDILASKQPTRNNPINPVVFTANWADQNFKQFFSSGTQLAPSSFTEPEPLVIPLLTVLAAAILGTVAFVWRSRRLLARPEIKLAAIIVLALVVSLWVFNYHDYLRYDAYWAVQGRYFLPVVPLAIILGLMSVRSLIRRPAVRTSLAALLVLGLLTGGGLLTDIIVSEPDWYWQNKTVINVNDSLRHVLSFLDIQFK